MEDNLKKMHDYFEMNSIPIGKNEPGKSSKIVTDKISNLNQDSIDKFIEHNSIRNFDTLLSHGNDIAQDIEQFYSDTKSNNKKQQDPLLPLHNVLKIMKIVLPEYSKVSQDARITMQECASEFISFIGSEAAELAKMERRRTLTAEDIIMAMTNLGFDNYLPFSKTLLEKIKHESSNRYSARRTRRNLD
uniref:Nuclear transcription factor Y subunit B-9 (Trinotate prediction) n=1 Tax=Myxobolus squamalis TaxID=59785 RepID=A0A6B2G362_MYXSQ